MLYFPADAHALFLGEEQEGEDKGVSTLFVVNQVSPGRILATIERLADNLNPVRQLYLGAGFLSRCTPEYIEQVANWLLLSADTDNLALTVEASYVDAHTLKTIERIDKWIYTVMMLDVVNPNYHNTMWMLKRPDCYKPLGLNEELLEKVYIKSDFGKTTLVTPLRYTHYSRYQDYGRDTLIEASDKYDARLPVPYPHVYEALRSEETFRFKVAAGESLEIKSSLSPKLIFRSNPT
jgi:hypothetical protein